MLQLIERSSLMWNSNWKRNLIITFRSTGGARSTLAYRKCDPHSVWFSSQASKVDWWCCSLLCECELFIRPFLYKATPTNFQFDLDEENQRSHFGALTMCHGIGSFAASSTSGCDVRTYSTRIMPFFVCHSDHIPLALQNSYRHHSIPFQDGSNDKTSHVNNAAQV